jgi:hypothetical protein
MYVLKRLRRSAAVRFTELFQPATRSWRKTAVRIGFKFTLDGRTHGMTDEWNSHL